MRRQERHAAGICALEVNIGLADEQLLIIGAVGPSISPHSAAGRESYAEFVLVTIERPHIGGAMHQRKLKTADMALLDPDEREQFLLAQLTAFNQSQGDRRNQIPTRAQDAFGFYFSLGHERDDFRRVRIPAANNELSSRAGVAIVMIGPERVGRAKMQALTDATGDEDNNLIAQVRFPVIATERGRRRQ